MGADRPVLAVLKIIDDIILMKDLKDSAEKPHVKFGGPVGGKGVPLLPVIQELHRVSVLLTFIGRSKFDREILLLGSPDLVAGPCRNIAPQVQTL